MKITTFISLIIYLFACFVMKAEKTQILGTWKKIGYLPGQAQMHVMLAAKGYLYAIGGRASYGWRTVKAHVFFAKIKKNGSLEKWQKTSPLPQAVAGHAAVAFDKHIYVISGKGHGADNIMKQPVSYIGTIKDDGSIESWRPTSSLPKDTFYRGAALIHDKTIYYVGGFFSRLVFRTQIQENGLLGEWKQEKKMVSSRMYFGLACWNGKLYALGGNPNTYYNRPVDSVLFSQIKTDGNLERWRRADSLPEANSMFSLAQQGKMVFIIGGGGLRKTVWCSSFNSEGELADWNKEKPFPDPVALGASAIYNNYIYHSGGVIKLKNGKKTVSSRVYMAKINKMDK
jgi:hypothetical protein